MNHVRKLRLIPFESANEKNIQNTDDEKLIQHGDGIKILPKEKVRPKVLNAINLIMKLAQIQGYNMDGKIRDKNGNFLEETDLALLVSNALNQQKFLFGEDAFVDLLREAKISPDMIGNENIKRKLSFNFANFDPPETSVSQVSTIDKNTDMQPVRIGTKRSAEEEENSEVIKKQRLSEDKSIASFEQLPLRTVSKRGRDENEQTETLKKPRMLGFGIGKWIIPK